MLDFIHKMYRAGVYTPEDLSVFAEAGFISAEQEAIIEQD